jgi:hypothetical protein
VPAACRISQTVDGATVTPSLVSSPWMRRCPPQWILFRQADDEAGDARSCRRAAGRAPLARVVFARSQPAVPGQQRRWRNREDAGPAAAGDQACQRAEPHPAGRAVPDPAGVAAQRRVLARSTSSSASFARSPRDIRTARPSIRGTSRQTTLRGIRPASHRAVMGCSFWLVSWSRLVTGWRVPRGGGLPAGLSCITVPATGDRLGCSH